MNRFGPMLVVALLLSGCGLLPGTGDPLSGHTFLSTSVTDDGVAHPLVEGTRIRLSFTDGKIGAAAGCNIYGGDYRLADGRILITGGSMTEMGCDDARSAQDDWLFTFLGTGPTYTLAGNDLTLTSNGTVITLLDTEVADPDRPLVGTTWTVTGLISGDTVSSIPDNVVATFLFKADGTVDIHSGCNSGGGGYTADDTTIRFSQLVTTDMACPGAAGQVETAVVAVISADVIDYLIDAGGMTLTAGDNGLQLSAD
jgi:heat shock protein HslJ